MIFINNLINIHKNMSDIKQDLHMMIKKYYYKS